jgi:glycosyltransferase involved in cell wall biosynthesis
MTSATRANRAAGFLDPATAPHVSIIIPAYCAEVYIKDAVESVLAQTFRDYEIIIINDGSPDTAQLERVLRPYQDSVVYLKQENRGPGAARNTGLLAARGEFVAFLDADDYWQPRFLEEQLEFIRRNPGCDLIYSDALIVGDTALAGRTFMQMNPSRGRVTFDSLLDERCTIVLSAVVARRQSIMMAGMFDERFRLSEDYDLWLRMAKAGVRMAYQKKVLVCHRDNPQGVSADPTRLFQSGLQVLDRVEREVRLTDKQRAALVRRRRKLEAYMSVERGKRALARGDFSTAAAALKEANEFYHSLKLRLVLLWLRVSPNLLLRTYNLLRPVEPARETVTE